MYINLYLYISIYTINIYKYINLTLDPSHFFFSSFIVLKGFLFILESLVSVCSDPALPAAPPSPASQPKKQLHLARIKQEATCVCVCVRRQLKLKFLMPSKVKLSLQRFFLYIYFSLLFFFCCLLRNVKFSGHRVEQGDGGSGSHSQHTSISTSFCMVGRGCCGVAYLNLWLCRYAVCPHCLGERKSDSGKLNTNLCATYFCTFSGHKRNAEQPTANS